MNANSKHAKTLVNAFRFRCSALAKDVADARQVYVMAVQALVNKHGVSLATGRMSDTWQICLPGYPSWISELDGEDNHPIFKELKELDGVGSEFGIGPTNLEAYRPYKPEI